jgi:hypothetical protein
MRACKINTETGVLSSYPLEVKRVLISEMARYLDSHDTNYSNISTNLHISWLLELLGQAFVLPIEDYSIIESSLNTYAAWLLDGSSRPLIIANCDINSLQYQDFYQVSVIN